MFIGAHIPRETTIVKTMEEIKKNGGNALQLFTTNPRSLKITDNSKYINESHLIKKFCKNNNFVIMVHSPYIFNIAKPFLLGKKQLDIKDTIVFDNKIFFYMKPTIINIIFALVLLYGQIFLKQPLLKKLFDGSIKISDEGWNILNKRWIYFFIFLAILNELVWRTQSEDFWVQFKVFGLLPITLIFTIMQVSLIQKYRID